VKFEFHRNSDLLRDLSSEDHSMLPSLWADFVTRRRLQCTLTIFLTI